MEFELEFIRNSKQIQGVVENIRSAESSAGAYNFAIDLQKDNFLLNGLDFSSGTAMPILNTTLWIQLGFATTGI